VAILDELEPTGAPVHLLPYRAVLTPLRLHGGCL